MRELLDLHNFLLERYYGADPVDPAREYDGLLGHAERVKPLVADVTEFMRTLALAGGNALFEGAQGAMLDIDLGTYPFVTSSNTTVGGALAGTGVGPASIDYVLGIVKAYATRVGAGPFPTELLDDMGEHLSRVGAEFGATTGRARRCGWFDAVLLKRAVFTNGLTGLCVTKLDVLDGLEEVKICVGYRLDGEISASPPLLTDRFAECEPVYEIAAWLVGADLGHHLVCCAAARGARLPRRGSRSMLGVPVDVVSTGPSRDAIVIRRHPFD